MKENWLQIQRFLKKKKRLSRKFCRGKPLWRVWKIVIQLDPHNLSPLARLALELLWYESWLQRIGSDCCKSCLVLLTGYVKVLFSDVSAVVHARRNEQILTKKVLQEVFSYPVKLRFWNQWHPYFCSNFPPTLPPYSKLKGRKVLVSHGAERWVVIQHVQGMCSLITSFPDVLSSVTVYSLLTSLALFNCFLSGNGMLSRYT